MTKEIKNMHVILKRFGITAVIAAIPLFTIIGNTVSQTTYPAQRLQATSSQQSVGENFYGMPKNSQTQQQQTANQPQTQKQIQQQQAGQQPIMATPVPMQGAKHTTNTDIKQQTTPQQQKKTTGHSQAAAHLMPEIKGEDTAHHINVPQSNSTTVMPEIATQIAMSASDINRVVCPAEDIKDVVFSKEKGATIKLAGKNAFVKFQVIKKDGKDVYITIPSEFFIVCGNNTYNIIAYPKRIPSQTITLTGGKKEIIKKNNAMFADMPYEKKVKTIIKQVYTDNIPDTYQITQLHRSVDVLKFIDLVLKRIINIEGEGLKVREYSAKLKNVQGINKVNISEKDFLKKEITTKPLAISKDMTTLGKSDTARIIIVEKTEGDN
ncbi:MAG: hypothetical protein ILNGONEN_00352 [Syntrophorhabdaceae bacterium]|jgi:conjugal transfer pilus assembly protein TraK|nr:hypothetical protein [Syntrophorhabdaceae bacterium]